MTLTLKGISRNGKRAIYTGAAIAVTLGLSVFPNKVAPPHIEIADGTFAPAKAPRVARANMTPEQKAAAAAAAKAARANKPKPTLAEKIEARRKALAKLEAQASQPSL